MRRTAIMAHGVPIGGGEVPITAAGVHTVAGEAPIGAGAIRAGQPNYIDIELLNTGKTQGSGTLSLFVTTATPNLNDPNSWIRLVDKPLIIGPQTGVFYEFPWQNLPAPGHYCLLAKWTDMGGDTNLQFNDLVGAVRQSAGDLIWHNINIVPGFSGGGGQVAVTVDWWKSRLSAQQNFGIKIGGIDIPTGDKLTVILPNSLASELRKEPTLKNVVFREEGATLELEMPLSDGVYYFPLPNNAPEKIAVPLRFKFDEKRKFNLPGAYTDFFQVRDIGAHKAGRDVAIGTVRYLLQ